MKGIENTLFIYFCFIILMKIDFHVHTNFSDGLNSVRDVLKQAVKIGLNGMMISDHDTVESSRFARKIIKSIDKEFLVIPGVEISTPNGDILAIDVDEAFTGMPQEIIEKIHEVGGLAVAAHPFGGYWPRPFVVDFDDYDFDAIEVLNGGVGRIGNEKAIKFAKEKNLPGTAGSDAHIASNIGSCFTTIEDAQSVEDIKKAIKSGRVRIETRIPELRVLLKDNV